MDIVRIVFLAVIGLLLLGALVLMWYPAIFPRKAVGLPLGAATSVSRLAHPEAVVGFLATFAIALFAHDPWVYGVALFVVASLLTDQGYLERVAAILRGGNSGYWKYLEVSTPAAIADKHRRETRELEDAEQAERTRAGPIGSSGGSPTADGRQSLEAPVAPAGRELPRVAKYERSAAAALSRLFPSATIQSNMVLNSRDRKRIAEIDFVVHTTRDNTPVMLVIEAKASAQPDIAARAKEHAIRCADIIRRSRVRGVPLVLPAVILPPTTASESTANPTEELVVFFLRPESEQFENADQVARWLGHPVRT